MKAIFKILTITVLVAVFLPKLLVYTNSGFIPRTYLVAGLDDTANNTDTLMLVSFALESDVSVVQVPRDTLVYDGKPTKINSLYSKFRNSGMDSRESLQSLSSFISQNLGIKTVGYLGISTGVFTRFIDAIGGIYVTIPDGVLSSQTLDALSLSVGENLLSGKEAISFVRHRASYQTADIGRLGAQKLFISGFYHTLTERLSNKVLIRAYKEAADELVSNFGIDDILALVMSGTTNFKKLNCSYATLPGAPFIDNGVSYYSLNRTACIDLLSELSLLYTQFDPQKMFVEERSASSYDIYNSKNIYYKIYKDTDLSELSVS